MSKPYIKVPTWNAGKWEYSIFQTKNEFRTFVKDLFKEPGKYNFDETAYLFNEHARVFEKKKMFCEAPEGSQDYYKYWDTEREKCRRGVIFKNGKEGIWYLPRFYYHWINFLRIYRKAPPKGFHFPDVRDVQYHMALYECLAELHNKNSVILKKRQIASSYFHIAKIYNRYIFEYGFVAKLLASDKKYINATASWKFLEEYHNFTNEHCTAWACSNNPHKEFSWKQAVDTKTTDGRKVTIGTKATISGISLDKDPVSPVGGAVDEVFYEEGGIAPTADITYNYMRAAMEEGGIVTGHFCLAGSVGDLSQCEPLRKFLLNPKGYDFYAVHTNLLDENGTEGETGLFIPEQWGMPGTQPGDEDANDGPPLPNCIDEYGNSLVEKAVQALNERYEYVKKMKDASDYQHLVSQKPRNIAEAFAIRTVSPFPIRHTAAQVKRIEDNTYFLKYVQLERDENDKIVMVPSDKKPMEYPTDKKKEDKTGVVVIHEDPIKQADGTIKWLLYLASIDPVETGDTKNSESLASVYIWKMTVEVTRQDGNDITVFTEGNKLVCEWVGRYDDPIKTNEQISRVLELYNAYGICEKNKPGFISYMQLKRRQKYLAKASDMIFDKEHENTDDTYKAYGYTMTPGLWKKLLQYGIDSVNENIGPEDKPVPGVTRIPFIWLLKEMQNYQDKGNYDRVIAYCALMAFVARQQAVMGMRKRIERTSTPIEDEKRNAEMRNLLNNRSPFRNIGRGSHMPSQYNIPKRPFKNLR